MTGREPARTSIDADSTASTEKAFSQIEEWMRDPEPWPSPEPPRSPTMGDAEDFDPLGPFKRGFLAGAAIAGAIIVAIWLMLR